jgi:hypothetical protein
MRYIVNAAGYVKNVSFGACITCGGVNCNEYEGAIPEGYGSLEEWFLEECESLYRWKIDNGNLTLDEEVEPPVPDAKHVIAAVVIGTAWTGNTVPYTQTIPLECVRANSIVEIALPATATVEEVKAFQRLNLQDGGQTDGSITLRAFGTKNTIEIPVNIVILNHGGAPGNESYVMFADGTLTLL